MSDKPNIDLEVSHFDMPLQEIESNYEVRDLRKNELPTAPGWMSRLLLNSEFQMISGRNLQAIFTRFLPLRCEAGKVVVQQGRVGENFYVVTEGRCKVTRELSTKTGSITLAELGVGDTFGEEALITGSNRQATVTMITDGAVMMLSKEDFKALLSDPIIDYVSIDQAQKLADGGAQWLHVGTASPNEGDENNDYIHIPMQILRHKCRSLNKEQHHIVTCDDITHSSAAAHILRQYGFQVSVVDVKLLNDHAA